MREDAAGFLEKAARAIRSAEKTLADGDAETAVSKSYYAMFYAAEALLVEKGLRFRKHAGVHTALARHFVKTGEIDRKHHRRLLDAFDRRVRADYELGNVADSEDASTLIGHAREFLAAARAKLEG